MHHIAHDAAIILSHRFDNHGNIGIENELRLKHAINLYHDGLFRTLVMSGNHSPSDQHISITHAQAMRQYALKLNVAEDDILLEEKSLDTVGQAIFTKIELAIPKRWRNIMVISTDYHMNRVKTIFSFVYNKTSSLAFEGVKCENLPISELDDKEKHSLETFLKTFKDVAPGDDESILMRLYKEHPLYALR